MLDDGGSKVFDWDLSDGTTSCRSGKWRKRTKECSDSTAVLWIMFSQNMNGASVFTEGCFLYLLLSVQTQLRKLLFFKKTQRPDSIPAESAHTRLRTDGVEEEDATAWQALKRVSFALLTPSHRLEATRDVQGIAGLGSDQTCADSIVSRKLESVAYELATVALSPVGGINYKQV